MAATFPRFTLGPVALGVLGLSVCVHLVTGGLAWWLGGVGQAGQSILTSAVGLLLLYGLAWMVWRLSRRRGGQALFCILVSLMTLGRLGETRHLLAGRAPATRNATGPVQAPGRQGLPTPASGEQAPEGSQKLGVELRELREAAHDAGGGEGKMMEAVSRVLERVQAKIRAFEEAKRELDAAGGVSVVGLDSPGAITRRRELVKAYAQANVGLTEASRGMEDALRVELRGTTNAVAAELVTRVAMTRFHTSEVVRVHNCTRRCAEAMDGLLALYEEEFPRWRLQEDRRLVFENAAAVARHQHWIQQLRAAEQERTALQDDMAKRWETEGAGP